jgi:hypothetical protein
VILAGEMNSMSQQYWPGTQAYSPGNSQQPSYAYRDLSLYYSASGADYTHTEKRQQFLRLRFFIKLFLFLFIIGGALILPLHNTAVYSTYKQGSCTITDKQVQEHDSRDKHGEITSRTYYPVLSYTVHPLSGGQASATGFDGPKQTGYSTSDDAQAIADNYQIGETTTCWYNPAEPDKAFLTFYGYGEPDAIGTFILGLLGFIALAISVYLLFSWTVWRLYALWKRGVVTQGTVMRNEERRNRSSKYIVSIIGFRALEEPNMGREITVRQALAPGSRVPVCYDPLYPRYRRYGAWPEGIVCVPGLLGIGILLLVAFIIMWVLWLIP